MFQRPDQEYTPSEPRNDRTPPAVFTVLGSGAKLEGTFEVADSIQIECEVGGQLKVGGRLVIGEKGSVRADVETVDAIIYGQYKGNMVATGSVEITPTGRVVGKIETDSLVISKGGFFNGKTLRLKEAQAEGVSRGDGRRREGLRAAIQKSSSSLREDVRDDATEDYGLSPDITHGPDTTNESPHREADIDDAADDSALYTTTSPRRGRTQAASRGGRKKKAKPKQDHGHPVTPKASEAEPLPPVPSRGEPLPDDVDLGGDSRLEDRLDRLMMRLGLAPGTAERSGSDPRDADDPLTRQPKRAGRTQAGSRGGRKKKAKPKQDHGRDVRTKESAVEADVTPASAIEDMAEFLPPLPSGGPLLSEDLDFDAAPPPENQREWADMEDRSSEARGSSFWGDDDLANDRVTREAGWESEPVPPPDDEEDPLGIR